MKDQKILNQTVNKAVDFWTKYLESQRNGDEFEGPIIMLKKTKEYPSNKTVEEFKKKLATFIILKLEENLPVEIETKEFPEKEFGLLISSLKINRGLFPQNTKMVILLGEVKITNFLGQEEIIKIS